MGGNASPLIADLYLSWCEYNFMQNLKGRNPILARKLNHIYRYLDDIACVNFRLFLDVTKDIYHNSLSLEKNDHDHTWDTFLDLLISIIRNRFRIGIYHKVDDFSFEVISFPFPDSNIHSSLGYKTFYTELVRFYRRCNNLKDFISRSKLIYSKLTKRGYIHDILYKWFKKFFLKYPVGVKYGVLDFRPLWAKIMN